MDKKGLADKMAAGPTRSSSESTFALIALLPLSLILPPCLYLALSICLSLSFLSHTHSILYSAGARIIQVCWVFLPASLPDSEANLCSLRAVKLAG